MESSEDKLKKLLDIFGKEVGENRNSIPIKSTSCIDKIVPNSAGVYWIETTMPTEEMRKEISKVIDKDKRTRAKPPKGTSLIEQNDNSLYVVYSGTEEDINKRLKQHLFNQGSVTTAKLGCVIDEEPFSKYEWNIGFKEIDGYEIRYAIEAWWRLNEGWPKFCLR